MLPSVPQSAIGAQLGAGAAKRDGARHFPELPCSNVVSAGTPLTR
jgi:hypothetical protein